MNERQARKTLQRLNFFSGFSVVRIAFLVIAMISCITAMVVVGALYASFSGTVNWSTISPWRLVVIPTLLILGLPGLVLFVLLSWRQYYCQTFSCHKFFLSNRLVRLMLTRIDKNRPESVGFTEYVFCDNFPVVNQIAGRSDRLEFELEFSRPVQLKNSTERPIVIAKVIYGFSDFEAYFFRLPDLTAVALLSSIECLKDELARQWKLLDIWTRSFSSEKEVRESLERVIVNVVTDVVIVKGASFRFERRAKAN